VVSDCLFVSAGDRIRPRGVASIEGTHRGLLTLVIFENTD